MIRQSLVAFLLFTWAVGAQPTTRPSSEKPFGVRVVGHGRPMILIPGLACSGEVWDSTVDHFKDRYECHVLTLAGFAGQPPVGGPSLETVRKGLADYIRQKKLDRPIIVGHGIGGFVAYVMGITEPDVVGALISVDGLPSLAAAMNPTITPEQLAQMAQSLRKQAEQITREQFIASQKRTLSIWLQEPDDLDRVSK